MDISLQRPFRCKESQANFWKLLMLIHLRVFHDSIPNNMVLAWVMSRTNFQEKHLSCESNWFYFLGRSLNDNLNRFKNKQDVLIKFQQSWVVSKSGSRQAHWKIFFLLDDKEISIFGLDRYYQTWERLNFFIRSISVQENFDSTQLMTNKYNGFTRIDSYQLTTQNGFLKFDSNRFMTKNFQNVDSNQLTI